MNEESSTVQETYFLAWFGVPLLVIYALAQGSLCLAIAPHRPDLKLVIEPFLLMLGLILHVQWRRVSQTLRQHDLARPLWIAAADCSSFVITFWASCMLIEAFLQEARLL